MVYCGCLTEKTSNKTNGSRNRTNAIFRNSIKITKEVQYKQTLPHGGIYAVLETFQQEIDTLSSTISLYTSIFYNAKPSWIPPTFQ